MDKSRGTPGWAVVLCLLTWSAAAPAQDKKTPAEWTYPYSVTTMGKRWSRVAVDRAGNVYLGFAFRGVARVGGKKFKALGYADMMLVKLNPQGIVSWTRHLGSKGHEVLWDLAVDHQDNLLVAGTYNGKMRIGKHRLAAVRENRKAYSYDMLVVKLSPQGEPIWITSAGGKSTEVAMAVAADSRGNTYCAGMYNGKLKLGGSVLPHVGKPWAKNVFVAKLSYNGNFVWAARGGGPRGATVFDIAVDQNANSYITGFVEKGTGSFGPHQVSDYLYLARLNAEGSFQWATSVGSMASGLRVVIDGGYPTILGKFHGSMTIGPNTLDAGSRGRAWFLGEASSGGTFMSGWTPASHAMITALQPGPVGSYYVAGAWSGKELDGSSTMVAAVRRLQIDSAGKPLPAWSRKVEGSSFAHELARGHDGSLYLAGSYPRQIRVGGVALPTADGAGGFVWKIRQAKKKVAKQTPLGTKPAPASQPASQPATPAPQQAQPTTLPAPKSKPSGPIISVELLVESRSPLVAKVVGVLGPMLRDLGARASFRLGFVSGVTGPGPIWRDSPAEVLADLLLSCCQRLAPARLLPFLGCMSRLPGKAADEWKPCARAAGVEPATLKKCSEGPVAKKHLKAENQWARNKGAKATTLFLAGKEYQGPLRSWHLRQAACRWFPGPPPALCRKLPAPVQVKATIITDRCCSSCKIEPLVARLRRIFLELEHEVVDYHTPRGRKLFRRARLKALPAVIFPTSIKRDREGYLAIKADLGRRRTLTFGNWNPTVKHYEKIVARRYGVLADGMVEDFHTRLTWTRTNAENRTWGKARRYCKRLRLGGHRNWRMPSLEEMKTVVHGCPYTRRCTVNSNFRINLYCGACSRYPRFGGGPGEGGCYWQPGVWKGSCGAHWTSNGCNFKNGRRRLDPICAFDVSLHVPGVGKYNKGSTFSVRCVRR